MTTRIAAKAPATSITDEAIQAEADRRYPSNKPFSLTARIDFSAGARWAAGATAPQQAVTTAEDLNALPNGTLVMSADGTPFRRVESGWLDYSTSAGRHDYVEDATTVLWQTSDGPKAIVLWVP